MTDGQWLWVFANWMLDNDEKLEGMCHECRTKALDTNQCSVCGKSIAGSEMTINPKFDEDRFNRLSTE